MTYEKWLKIATPGMIDSAGDICCPVETKHNIIIHGCCDIPDCDKCAQYAARWKEEHNG
ncbi:MAG: hypothetical protein WCP79_06880 [Bacillota bacterium]